MSFFLKGAIIIIKILATKWCTSLFEFVFYEVFYIFTNSLLLEVQIILKSCIAQMILVLGCHDSLQLFAVN